MIRGCDEEEAMALKWIGSMLVLFSAGGFGIWSAMQWRERLRLLEKLRQMIYFLKGEITYSHAPLAEDKLQSVIEVRKC